MRTVGPLSRASKCAACDATCPNTWSDPRGYVQVDGEVYCDEECEKLAELMGGEPPQVYQQIVSLCLPLIEAYENDLLLHDRRMIVQHPEWPFLHWTRDTGTHMVQMPPADSDVWPAKGEVVPFLFGRADREHILKSTTVLAGSIHRDQLVPGNKRQRAVYYFDGKRLRSVTPAEAYQVAQEYVRKVQREWESTGSRMEAIAC